MKFELMDFPSTMGVTQILKIIAQLNTNGVLMLGKKKFKVIFFSMRGASEHFFSPLYKILNLRLTSITLILKIVTQIHINGALMLSKKKNSKFAFRRAGEMYVKNTHITLLVVSCKWPKKLIYTS